MKKDGLPEMPYDPEGMSIAVANALKGGRASTEEWRFLDKQRFNKYGLSWTTLLFYGRPTPAITVLDEDINSDIASKVVKGQSMEVLWIPRQKPIPPTIHSISGIVASISLGGEYLYESPGLKMFRMLQAGQ